MALFVWFLAICNFFFQLGPEPHKGMAEVVGTVLVQPRRLAAGPQVPLPIYYFYPFFLIEKDMYPFLLLFGNEIFPLY